MTSYAEFPASMHSQDFDLYPSQDYTDLLATGQAFVSTGSYLDSGFTASASTNPGFNPQLQAFANPTLSAQGFSSAVAGSTVARCSPSGSPQSGTQSFELHPPHLSSSSDSSASVSSSAMGSPSLNQNQIQEAWAPFNQGLGLEQTIISKDSFVPEPFATTAFSYDGLVATDKLSGFVGESHSISSPQSSRPRSAVAPLFISPFVRSSSPVVSPLSASSAPASAAESCGTPALQPTVPKVDSASVFKSPTTPASAMLASPLSSPSAREAGRVTLGSPVMQRGRRYSLLSNQIWPVGGQETPESPFTVKSSSESPRSSVYQDNNSFIPPLASSCPSFRKFHFHFSLFLLASSQFRVSISINFALCEIWR